MARAGAPADWPGWRGLEREGRTEPGDYPTQWSPDKGIRWKTPIPGKGHSSPIVVGDSVLVTTAYPTGKGETLKRIAAWGTLLLTLAIAGAAVALAALASRRDPPPGLAQAVAGGFLCLAFGALAQLSHVAFARFGATELSTDERMACWLLSANIATLCLILAAAGHASRLTRRALALLALALSAVTILARPSPEYFDPRIPGRSGADLIWSAALPLVLPLSLPLSWLVNASRFARLAPRLARPASRAAVLAAAALGLALGLLSFKLPPLYVVTFCAAAWLIPEVLGYRLAPPGLTGWFTVAIVAIGALGLFERSALQVTKEFARALVCLDRETGAVKWTREGLHGPQPPVSHRNSPATPTPASDGERVVAWFGSAGILCTDLRGKVLWTRGDVPFDDVHGLGASPILADGLVIIPGTQPDAPYIAALDARTGKRVWTANLRPWPGAEGQHRTPSLVTIGGKKAVLVWAWDGSQKEDRLRAFDPASGRQLWSCPAPTEGEQVAGIVPDGDMVYLPTSKAVTALSLSMLSRGEAPTVWTTPLKCRGQLVASPVLCNGLLFVVSAHRDAHCLDAKTGELLWSQQLNGRGCMASPVGVPRAGERSGGDVYFPDVSGRITVVAAERAFRRVAENDLGEPLWASPAPVAGRLLIRTARHLWCVGN